jgi:hypothetical protein
MINPHEPVTRRVPVLRIIDDAPWTGLPKLPVATATSIRSHGPHRREKGEAPAKRLARWAAA